MWFVLVFAAILSAYGALSKHAESDFQRLPKVHYLDDFESCLMKEDGVYCAGLFEISSDDKDNPLWRLIQEKSQDDRLYNRTLLHRAYCLTTRCPSRDQNTTARFERCVNAETREYSLQARLQTLYYCRSHGQQIYTDTNDTPHRVFLYIVYAILILNVLGTVYDYRTGKKDKKNSFLMMFSLRANSIKLWTQGGGETNQRCLKVFNGFKTFSLVGAIFAHEGLITAQVWQQNPRFIEKFFATPVGGLMGALTTTTQVFVLISNFLTTYNLLLFSRRVKISFAFVPILFLRRFIRMLPIYWLLNGFSATWWTKIGDGPYWPVVVGSESKICRDKFWPQAFFLQNMFNPTKLCNIQTWVMAVDLQLYVPSLIITILLINHQKWALKILYGLLGGAIVLTGYVSISGRYIPAFTYMTPENFREMFTNNRNFMELFIKPINCIITMVIGIILGFMCFNMQKYEEKKCEQEKKDRPKPSKLLILLHVLSGPGPFIWGYFCSTLIPISDPMFMAVMMPVERIVNGIFAGTLIYTSMKFNGIYTKILGWRGWRLPSRMSMSISMIHWCVNMTLLANRYALQESSLTKLVCDTIDVTVISFIIAIPMTLLVEYPLTKVLNKLLSYLLRPVGINM